MLIQVILFLTWQFKINNLVQKKMSKINQSDWHIPLAFITSLILPKEKVKENLIQTSQNIKSSNQENIELCLFSSLIAVAATVIMKSHYCLGLQQIWYLIHCVPERIKRHIESLKDRKRGIKKLKGSKI